VEEAVRHVVDWERGRHNADPTAEVPAP
jgi:hypothetical protein